MFSSSPLIQVDSLCKGRILFLISDSPKHARMRPFVSIQKWFPLQGMATLSVSPYIPKNSLYGFGSTTLCAQLSTTHFRCIYLLSYTITTSTPFNAFHLKISSIIECFTCSIFISICLKCISPYLFNMLMFCFKYKAVAYKQHITGFF